MRIHALKKKKGAIYVQKKNTMKVKVNERQLHDIVKKAVGRVLGESVTPSGRMPKRIPESAIHRAVRKELRRTSLNESDDHTGMSVVIQTRTPGGLSGNTRGTMAKIDGEVTYDENTLVLNLTAEGAGGVCVTGDKDDIEAFFSDGIAFDGELETRNGAKIPCTISLPR